MQLKWKNSMSWTLDKAVMSGDKRLIVNKLEIVTVNKVDWIQLSLGLQ